MGIVQARKQGAVDKDFVDAHRADHRTHTHPRVDGTTQPPTPPLGFAGSAVHVPAVQPGTSFLETPQRNLSYEQEQNHVGSHVA